MPKTPDYFVGKTIFITGAASGLGRETAHIFAREGANVTCADVNAEGAAAVADEISGYGGQAIAADCDVTDGTQVAYVAHTATVTTREGLRATHEYVRAYSTTLTVLRERLRL